ncbi:outer membrane beta-barrel family protein [Mucilaginibacter sp. X5P1]|uniref:outer membrane beta-barrel family protein n=1 Tax=Mucilaginibacter sp. X5P1 TaxID=2723088 RepID=UPI00161EDFCC|nr:outer membrane beta-barrel family protein [Mucilaginibacter sp. X5P1]MBB6140072.1 hypothetical protein [Mucilaginibacter sp. X5P1]
MKLTIILTLFCLSSLSLFAQSPYSIKGAITDTTEKVKLTNTTVAVLNAKDSILRKFVWTAKDGSFAMSNLPKGKFILLVTYPGYADYVDNFSLDSLHKSVDFGNLNMILKSRLLEGVIIKGQVTAIKIKGDTTEYNAKAYKINPNDKVEDLLRQLPGIEVDKDGKITAQGQTVSKVLVDGEEFFGDDPTLVTKNIRADMVDKVQLYDKKSDQAAFTGIDDGVKTKTINIKLKEDKKNGYFGKVDAGGGTDGYYEEQALFNKFTPKTKVSIYGTLSNTGKTGLGWQDAGKAGTTNLQSDDNGGIYFSNGGSDELDSFNGQYNGQGIPIARSGGVHYDGKWDADKQSINANYKIGSIGIDEKDSTLTQNNLPGSIINTNTDANSHKYLFRQKADLTYSVKLDTSQTLKIAVDGTDKHSNVLEDYSSVSKRNMDTLLNRNNRTVTNDVYTKIFNASAFYTKKFKKVGRTLSWNVSESINNSNSKGYLKSNTDFFNGTTGSLDSSQRIDQYKTTNIKSSVLNSNITYTEPLSKRVAVVLNYGLSVSNGESDRVSYDSTAVGRYDHIDTALSNDYKLTQLSNQVGAVFNYKKDKTIINFGTKVADVTYRQSEAFSGDIFKRHFINWAPQANYQYKFSQQQSISINYNGTTTQPTIDQIQPVVNNSDPLNITIGNPNLKPSFSNNINFNYNSYKVISGQNLYAYGGLQFTDDPIVSNTATDNTGKSVFQSVNLSGKTPYNFYFGAYFGQKIKGDYNIGFEPNINGNTSYNYTNSELNTTDSYTYAGRLTLSKYIAKKYNFYVGFGPTYTVQKSSLQPLVNNNGLGYTGNVYLNVYLPGKFQLSSSSDYQYNPKTASFNESLSKYILNASLIKSFFKEDNLKLSVSGNDLLNQNVGFTRNAYGNSITQNSYTTIKRYFMFSVIWDFNKFGTTKSAK